MKRSSSVLIFALLVASSALSSLWSCHTTQQNIVRELNQSLQLALVEKQATWFTPDTIANYQRMQGAIAAPLAINLRDQSINRTLHPSLRDMTFVQLRLVDSRYATAPETNGYLCSDTILYTDQQTKARIAIRSMAQCSQAQLFAMSDQRLSLALSLLSLLWMLTMLTRGKKSIPQPCPLVNSNTIGGITLQGDTFYDTDGRELHLTPMQRKLLTMFFLAPDRKLSQSDICATLWPKKDDASETLYALITRTKRAVESRSTLKIEVDRGRGYSLTASQ